MFSFSGFKRTKEYYTKGEKAADFISGSLTPVTAIVAVFVAFAEAFFEGFIVAVLVSPVIWLGDIIGFFYFWNRRRWLSYGFLFGLIVACLGIALFIVSLQAISH